MCSSCLHCVVLRSSRINLTSTREMGTFSSWSRRRHDVQRSRSESLSKVHKVCHERKTSHKNRDRTQKQCQTAKFNTRGACGTPTSAPRRLTGDYIATIVNFIKKTHPDFEVMRDLVELSEVTVLIPFYNRESGETSTSLARPDGSHPQSDESFPTMRVAPCGHLPGTRGEN